MASTYPDSIVVRSSKTTYNKQVLEVDLSCWVLEVENDIENGSMLRILFYMCLCRIYCSVTMQYS